MSARLYRVFQEKEKNPWSVKEFVNCFEILSLGNLEQKLYLVFKMLDFDEDGCVTREDCRSLLQQLPAAHSCE